MKGSIKHFLFASIGALFLMFAAFYNGFPIVCSDTSTYIASGFELETPFDRPITYGLFLRLFSLNGYSLWFVVFFQGLILSHLIFLLAKIVAIEKSYIKFGLLAILFLSLFTSVSWTVSQIMPDIFTSIALLCTILIFIGKFRGKKLILLYVLFFLAVAMHMSHILLFVLILIASFGLGKYILPKKYYPKRNLQIAILMILTIASIVTMGSAISKSKHVFFMGAMVEHGITKKYLDENCVTKPYKLCVYKDSLPDRGYNFIWDEKSPFYKIGGWKETEEEFNDIIYGTLTQPKYMLLHIKESFKATIQQLTLFNIGDGNVSFLSGTLLYERIGKYFSHDLASYSKSKQNLSQLEFVHFFNLLFSIVVVTSLISLIHLLTKYSHILKGDLKVITILFFIGLILNAWDCGTFANAIGRLGAKMIWIVPFLAVLCLLKLFPVKDTL